MVESFVTESMEFIFPNRMGYLPKPAANLDQLDSWQGLMIEFSLPFSVSTLDMIVNDPRGIDVQALRVSSRAIDNLVAHAGKLPKLDTVFLEDEGLDFLNKTNDPTNLVNTYPGLAKLYMKKGFEKPDEPLRHIGLDYLGLPYAPAKKRLSDLICPNLRILALDVEGINASDAPVHTYELVEQLETIVTGNLFPRLERLHLSNCEFINRFTGLLNQLGDSLTIEQLDIMNAIEVSRDGTKETADIEALLNFAAQQKLRLTTDAAAAEASKLIKTNTVLLPY